MTPNELKSLLDNVVTEANSVASFAGVLDPQIMPFIAIGKAVDKQLPGLAASVDRWIQGEPPTDAEKADMAAKLAVLKDPNCP